MKGIKFISLLLTISALMLAGCNTMPTEKETTDLMSEVISDSQDTATEERVDSETETETQQKEDKVMELVDFIVSVPADRDPVILQLTDPQIIDASKKRTPDRLDSTHDQYWAPDQKNARCYDYLREIIENTDPDLILITGDIVYGEFDDDGGCLLEFIEFMDSYKIPWAPVFGNHDNDSKMGVDWQCDQFENSEYCLFLQRTLTGNGNYTVGIEQGGKLTRVFFMLDSNKPGVGFGSDQIKWYTKCAEEIAKSSPETKLSMAFHVQLAVFGDAFAKYGTNGSSSHVHIDQLEDKGEDDFGYIGAAMKSPWDSDRSVWNGIKELGFDSVFVGHEHANSASIVYEGVRLQFGMKCSAYDRLNYIDKDGNIACSYYSEATPWVGGSYFKLSEDGSIRDAGIYYCENAGGEIDWDSFKPAVEEKVSGLQKDVDFTMEGGISVKGVQFDESINAYKVTASNQGKVKINAALVKNKSTFTFTVYVPVASNMKLQGYGEFAIRTKPNEIEPAGDGKVQGYIDYNSSSSNSDYKIIYDTWQTFTVDISDFGEQCTEFAFVIAAGNTIYIRDMVIE